MIEIGKKQPEVNQELLIIATGLFDTYAARMIKAKSGVDLFPDTFLTEQDPIVINFWMFLAASLVSHTSGWELDGKSKPHLSNFERNRLKHLPLIK